METMTVQELKQQLDTHTPVVLVDLQSEDGYAHRHIPGAMHMIPSDSCDADCLAMLKDKDAMIVLYGEFDELGKGSTMGDALAKAGYVHVCRLAGGLMSWMEAGYRVEGGRES